VAREVPLGGPVAAHLLALGLVASLLLPSAARAATPDESPGLAAFTATIDALAAHERSNGGWTFDAPAGERPHPFTLVMQMAEGVAAPLDRGADGARVATAAAARPGYDWQGDYGIPALLRRLALGGSQAPPAPLPGDPGACAGVPHPMLTGKGAPSLIAEAGMQLAAIEPPPISPCAGTPRELVAAGGLR
jgi:hypothetical protein